MASTGVYDIDIFKQLERIADSLEKMEKKMSDQDLSFSKNLFDQVFGEREHGHSCCFDVIVHLLSHRDNPSSSSIHLLDHHSEEDGR